MNLTEKTPEDALTEMRSTNRELPLAIRPTHVVLPEGVSQEDATCIARYAEGWRPICPKRARKLRRRGDHVRYLPEFGSDAWQPPHLKRKNT